MIEKEIITIRITALSEAIAAIEDSDSIAAIAELRDREISRLDYLDCAKPKNKSARLEEKIDYLRKEINSAELLRKIAIDNYNNNSDEANRSILLGIESNIRRMYRSLNKKQIRLSKMTKT